MTVVRERRTIVRKMRTKMKQAIEWIFPKVRRRVLSLLLGKPASRWHLRDIERQLGFSVNTLKRELEGLAGSGILMRSKEGNRTYFQANTRCPIYPELRGLILKTVGLVDILRDALEPLADKIKVAFVYGSMAKGDAVTESDVDLMIVGEVTLGDVVQPLAGAQDKLGREINATVYRLDEFKQKLASGHHFVATVIREPKMFVIGDENDLGAVGGQRVD